MRAPQQETVSLTYGSSILFILASELIEGAFADRLNVLIKSSDITLMFDSTCP